MCERLMDLLPHVKQYVKSVADGKSPDPKTKSFDVVKHGVVNPLLEARLSFFLSVARQITPFLTLYQTDKPMMPFLCGDLYKMLKTLMDRFVKDELMAQQMLKVDVDSKESRKVYSKLIVS